MWLASPMSTCDIKMKKSPSSMGFLEFVPTCFSLFFLHMPQQTTKNASTKPSFSEVYLRVFGFYLSWWHVASSTSRLALNQSLQVPLLTLDYLPLTRRDRSDQIIATPYDLTPRGS